ncbi:hypothetical protein [Aeromicrobium sp. Leaf350]|uniref:hypothetical protein n=1 Tax=Aeromicrobium sp. Leaf350 TaxID=2876565 RepID=UPI001E3929D3|nr:hypothetical protein [Aeromicrobium sp. Leaf350]
MPNPTEVHDPRSGAWVAVLPSATTTAVLQEGFDTLEGTLLAASSTLGLRPDELRELAGLDDPSPRSFVDLVTVAPHPLMTILDAGRFRVERTRVPNGSCLWRVDADGERRVLTYYDGPAYGWRNGRGYLAPTEALGPWGTLGGREYAAAFPAGETERVGLVAVGDEPPDGFTWTRPGVSQRYVAVSDLESLVAR